MERLRSGCCERMGTPKQWGESPTLATKLLGGPWLVTAGRASWQSEVMLGTPAFPGSLSQQNCFSVLLQGTNPGCIDKLSGQCFTVLCSSVTPSWFSGLVGGDVYSSGQAKDVIRKAVFGMFLVCTPFAKGKQHSAPTPASRASVSHQPPSPFLGCWCLR